MYIHVKKLDTGQHTFAFRYTAPTAGYLALLSLLLQSKDTVLVQSDLVRALSTEGWMQYSVLLWPIPGDVALKPATSSNQELQTDNVCPEGESTATKLNKHICLCGIGGFAWNVSIPRFIWFSVLLRACIIGPTWVNFPVATSTLYLCHCSSKSSI